MSPLCLFCLMLLVLLGGLSAQVVHVYLGRLEKEPQGLNWERPFLMGQPGALNITSVCCALRTSSAPFVERKPTAMTVMKMDDVMTLMACGAVDPALLRTNPTGSAPHCGVHNRILPIDPLTTSTTCDR